jgi:predicted ferric reductase/Ca2+-binding EF-hand superfamily protein
MTSRVAKTLVDAPPPSRAHPIDERLLARIERSFAHLAGDDAVIDAAELRQALKLRSEYLAGRVLRAFDREGNGTICRREFLEGVRALVFGTTRDKLLFVFRVHDHDGDGALTRQELLRIVTLSLAEDDITVRPADADRLVDTLYLAADRGRDGHLSFAEFEAAVRARPEVLRQITRSEARWIAPNEDLLGRLDGDEPRPSAIATFVTDRPAAAVALVLWVLANAALFTLAVIRYAELGAAPPILVARGAGACLNLNGALILVPMMRRLLTWVRTTPLAHVVPVDDAVDAHRLVGFTAFAFGVVHGAAHLVNYAFFTERSFAEQLFLTQAGATGLAVTVVFAVMWLCARDAVRRSGRFELFYFTHLLYLAWFALLLAHGPVFWMWTLVPLAGFVVEQVLRLRRRSARTEVIAGRALRSGVTRLDLRRPPGFRHRAGDYLFLRLPDVARHEWHPFTISSAPEREGLTVHVRSLGNWTAALRRLVEAKHAAGSEAPLVAYVDGPYGTPSAHIFETPYVVLVGAGIGVTPFASVLESLLFRAYGQGASTSQLKKAHFFWLNRDQYSFEWFAALLARLEEVDTSHLLDVNICMTGGRGTITAAGLALAREVAHEAGHEDVVTGLRAKTSMGHPEWDRLLGDIARQHAPARVEVFFCGPRGLAAKLRPVCLAHGMGFHEEKF